MHHKRHVAMAIKTMELWTELSISRPSCSHYARQQTIVIACQSSLQGSGSNLELYCSPYRPIRSQATSTNPFHLVMRKKMGGFFCQISEWVWGRAKFLGKLPKNREGKWGSRASIHSWGVRKINGSELARVRNTETLDSRPTEYSVRNFSAEKFCLSVEYRDLQYE